METYGDTWIEPVEGAWEWNARVVRRLAARRGITLDEDRLLLYDVRDLMALRHCVETALGRRDRQLGRAIGRLLGRLQIRSESDGPSVTVVHNKERACFPTTKGS